MAKIAIIVGRTHNHVGGWSEGKAGDGNKLGKGAKYTDARVHVLRKVLTAPHVRVISDILFRMGNRTDEN